MDFTVIAKEIENWSGGSNENICISSNSSSYSRTHRVCSWSNYFVENVSNCTNNPTNNTEFSKIDKSKERVTFTAKQAQNLLQFVAEEEKTNIGEVDWEVIADKISAIRIFSHGTQIFTARDCYIHYHNVESLKISKNNWGADEDRKLLALSNKYEECGWVQIAEELGTNRTPLQCLQRYQQALNKKLVNCNEWSKEEDAMLRTCTAMYGTRNWQVIASFITGRSASQCGNRYRKSSGVREDLIDGTWLEVDERRLFLAAVAYEIPTSSIFKKSTAEIEELFNSYGSGSSPRNTNTATENTTAAVTTASNTTASNNTKDTTTSTTTIPVTIREKKKYLLTKTLVANTGEATLQQVQLWSAVAKLVPGKSDDRCREKWCNSLDPTLTFGSFLPREYELLRILIERDGIGAWAEKATWFHGRTDSNVMSRWKTHKISDKNEVKTYAEARKLKLAITMPYLNRGTLSNTSLSVEDYAPVLRATLPTAIPVFDSISNSMENNDNNNSSSSSSSNSRGRGSSRKEHVDKKCSKCGDSIDIPDETDVQSIAKICSMCFSYYHNECCDDKEDGQGGSYSNSYDRSYNDENSSNWLCNICVTVNMIDATEEGDEGKQAIPNKNKKNNKNSKNTKNNKTAKNDKNDKTDKNNKASTLKAKAKKRPLTTSVDTNNANKKQRKNKKNNNNEKDNNANDNENNEKINNEKSNNMIDDSDSEDDCDFPLPLPVPLPPSTNFMTKNNSNSNRNITKNSQNQGGNEGSGSNSGGGGSSSSSGGGGELHADVLAALEACENFEFC